MKTYKLAEKRLVKWWDDVGHYYISHTQLKVLLQEIQRASIETGEQSNPVLKRYFDVKQLMKEGAK